MTQVNAFYFKVKDFSYFPPQGFQSVFPSADLNDLKVTLNVCLLDTQTEKGRHNYSLSAAAAAAH